MSGIGTPEIVLALLALVAIGVVALYSRRQKDVGSDKSSYLEALELLIDGDENSAIQKFKDSISEDTTQLSPYLRLGDVLRRRGLAANAVRVHRELTLRENLTREDRQRINRSLMLDYEAIGEFGKGAEIARDIIAAQRKPETWVVQKLLFFLEKDEKWKEAEEALSRYSKNFENIVRNRRLALYRLFAGLQMDKNGKLKESRVRFREAIKKDQNCIPAYYYLGHSYHKEKRTEDAIAQWTKLCKIAPEKAQYVFADLEKAWFEIGRFNDAESLYQEMISSGEIVVPAGLALAEIYHKKGDDRHAVEVLDQLRESIPDDPAIIVRKVSYLNHNQRYREAAAEALDFLNRKQATVDRLESGSIVCQDLVEVPEWICKCKKTG